MLTLTKKQKKKGKCDSHGKRLTLTNFELFCLRFFLVSQENKGGDIPFGGGHMCAAFSNTKADISAVFGKRISVWNRRFAFCTRRKRERPSRASVLPRALIY